MVTCAKDVDAHFQKGLLKFPFEDASQHDMGNYVDCAFNLKTLAYFVNASTPELLAHPFCDVVFVRYLYAPPAAPGAAPAPRRPALFGRAPHWMYYWRRSGSMGQACDTYVEDTLQSNVDLFTIAFRRPPSLAEENKALAAAGRVAPLPEGSAKFEAAVRSAEGLVREIPQLPTSWFGTLEP